MAWTNVGTKANGVVIAQGDWNEFVGNFQQNGGVDGDTKTGNWKPATTLTYNLGTNALSWLGVMATSIGAPTATFDFGVGSNNFSNSTSQMVSIYGNVRPISDNLWSCGTASLRWNNMYTVNAPTVGSSRALKDNIVPLALDEALDVLRRTTFHRYTRRSDPEQHVVAGFIAEDTDRALSLDGKSAEGITLAAYTAAALKLIDARLTAAGL